MWKALVYLFIEKRLYGLCNLTNHKWQIRKEYSSHASALKLIGWKELVLKNSNNTLKNNDFCEYVKFRAISVKYRYKFESEKFF